MSRNVIEWMCVKKSHWLFLLLGKVRQLSLAIKYKGWCLSPIWKIQRIFPEAFPRNYDRSSIWVAGQQEGHQKGERHPVRSGTLRQRSQQAHTTLHSQLTNQIVTWPHLAARKAEKSRLSQMEKWVTKNWDPITKRGGEMITGWEPAVLHHLWSSASLVLLLRKVPPRSLGLTQDSSPLIGTTMLWGNIHIIVCLSPCSELYSYQSPTIINMALKTQQNHSSVLWLWEVIYSLYAV